MSAEKRSRGRPRQFDEREVLEAARDVFWQKGLSATSLDDLAEAMRMNRPSIYRAFGDKEALYRKALAQFRESMEAAYEHTMGSEADVHDALTRFYSQALGVYTSGERPRGCLVMSTAVAAAACHPEIQADLLAVIRDLDKKIASRLRAARQAGQLSAAFDVNGRGAVAQGILHSLSLRARAGESPTKLRRLIRCGVQAVLS